MELELLRGLATEEKTDGGEDRADHRRQAALELTSLLAEARRVGRTPIQEEDFRSWKGEFRTRLHGLEVALAQASAHSEVRMVRMDPSIYSGMQDRECELHNRQPTSWYSQMQEAHDRTCGCGDVSRHFRRNSSPPAPRSSSKQRAVQPK